MAFEWLDSKRAGTARLVIERLDKVLGLTEDGSVSLGLGGDYDMGVAILADCARFSKGIPEHQRIHIAQRAVVDSKKAGEFDDASIRRRMEISQKAYLKQPNQPYVLLSTISLRHTEKLTSRRYDNAVVTFMKDKPRKFKLPQRIDKPWQPTDAHPLGYTFVQTRVLARDEISAGELALQRLDVLRAIWNLFYGYGVKHITFGGSRTQPINPIVLGPIHTLHHPSGTPATELFWSVPNYGEPNTVKTLEESKKLRRFERWIRRQLRKSQIGTKAVDLLIRRVRALDEADRLASFLKLWSCLEDLTNTGRGTYDTTIKRASFIFKERAFHRSVLEHLRSWRNRVVHEAAETDRSEEFVNQLQFYTDEILLFLISRSGFFGSLEEFGAFLDLPADQTILRTRIKHYELALTMLRREQSR
jgi:hypothetical protein